ncbi:DUF3795 domain-containing protein [Fibrobacterota bacterium]
MNEEKSINLTLAGPCGFYCGTCRHYLARAKGMLKEKNLKHGCRGCRIQEKRCAWIKRDCALVRKHQIEFCFQCGDFPCANLKKLDERHVRDDNMSLIDNLLRIQKIGPERWLREQEDRWRCPACGGTIGVMDGECYDCGKEADCT